LNHQVSGQIEKAEALLAPWKADERARYSGYLQRIKDGSVVIPHDVVDGMPVVQVIVTAPLAVIRRLACHELHLFLSVHDVAFYDKVVRPFLQNKPEKQLVDHYLLGDDLILENRIEEAISRFAKIESKEVSTNLQYDYLAGYLALHRGDYASALQLATKYENQPVPRWRDRFAANVVKPSPARRAFARLTTCQY